MAAVLGVLPCAMIFAQTEAVTPCDDARIVARVGSEVVLESDVVTLFVRDALEKLDKPISPENREELIKTRLRYHVELKMILLDAKREIPEEAMPKIKDSIGKHFDEKEVPAMMKITKTNSRQELEERLHFLGTSLQRQRLVFIERAMAMQWMMQKVESSDPITHEKMLEYYQEHLADYEHPARARWEELTVRFSSPSDRQDAYARIVRMGNLVLDGAAFSEVAKNGSDGITAKKGGAREWTTKGSLVMKTIDNAIFSLPLGELSPILESENGYHIVRVIERQEAHRTSFLEAQSEIRKTIKQEKSSQSRQEYLAKLQKGCKIWTMFDKADNPLLQSDRRGAVAQQ